MLLIFLFCAGFMLASAFPTTNSKILHERRETRPTGWTRSGRIKGEAILPMRIGLVQTGLHKGHDILLDISSPSSSNYGYRYTAEEVIDMFAPAQSSVDVVTQWLNTSGIKGASLSTNKQWIQFDAAVEDVETLLDTRYFLYKHEQSSSINVACEEYSLPEHVREHVDYITPGIKLFVSSFHASKDSSGKSLEKRRRTWRRPPPKNPMPESPSDLLKKPLERICQIAIIPECIAALYNITKGNKAATGNELGIFEDVGDVYSQADLNLFFSALAPYIPNGTHPILEAIDGAVAPVPVSAAGSESDLDFQISYPIIWPQNSILFQTDDPVYEANYTFGGFLNNFLDAIDGSYCAYSAFGETGNSPLDPPYPDPAPGGYKGQLQCGVYKPTNVISISYGGQEGDGPVNYQRRQCNEYMKLGLQGITVVVSSGDTGVGGPPDDDNEDGCLGTGQTFSPSFPVNCPYVLTVGSTFLPPGGDVYKDEEVATTRFPSGGGFSNIFPSPSYQASAVGNYFANYNPPYPYYSTVNNESIGANGGIYNRIGRASPDVSAIGDKVVIFNKGAPILIGGTSAAAPTWGAILTRINEERIAAGKGTVGFVNPVLYAHPEVLHDITVGSNPGCGTGGFNASVGWDPVTGLGTPNYPALLELFMSLN